MIKAIQNVTFSEFKEIPILLQFSSVELISALNVFSNSKSIHLFRSSVALLELSSFGNNGEISNLNGGAIYIKESNATIANSTFTQNSAYEGGAIRVD
jgi:hypothetical protein